MRLRPASLHLRLRGSVLVPVNLFGLPVYTRRPEWIFLPVLGMPVAHAPVLRFDLLARLRRPISRRLFGENKTWRGALVMGGGTLAATIGLYRVPEYRRRLPPELAEANPALVGLLLGSAVWVGELPNSFVKRRLGIAPGKQRRSPVGVAISIVDQGDWVPTAWLFLRPLYPMNAATAGRVFVIVAAIHVPVNLVGYAIGARTSPI